MGALGRADPCERGPRCGGREACDSISSMRWSGSVIEDVLQITYARKRRVGWFNEMEYPSMWRNQEQIDAQIAEGREKKKDLQQQYEQLQEDERDAENAISQCRTAILAHE